jgi:uncharacterized integral membrane protein (TIGR00698 family)
MLALLFGLIIGAAVRLPQSFKHGFKFAASKVLRLGVVLLGIRLTLFDVLKLGAQGVPIVVLCVLGALFITNRINKRLELPKRLGTLISVGTSICGVSAILATGPAINADEEESAYAVAVITIFGLVATIAYPYIAHAVFSGDPIKAGLFLGTSVHDTSQVVGSAKVYVDVFSDTATLDVATVTKLVRNVFMAALIPFLAFTYAHKSQSQEDGQGKQTSVIALLPRFVLGFLILAVLRSIGDAGIKSGGSAFGVWANSSWTEIITVIKTWASNLLVVALSGVGLSTDFRSFKGMGVKPFLVGLCAALAVGVISFFAITLMGSLVTLRL